MISTKDIKDRIVLEMKAGNKDNVSYYRFILSEIQKKENSQSNPQILEPKAINKLIGELLATVEETAPYITREHVNYDAVQKELAFYKALYVPPPAKLGVEETRTALLFIMDASGCKTKKDRGTLIGMIKSDANEAVYDMKLVNQLLGELLV